jgi:hypothetical protein
MTHRFVAAMSVYAILAVLASFTLTGKFLAVTLVILGGFALKTWLVVQKHKQD